MSFTRNLHFTVNDPVNDKPPTGYTLVWVLAAYDSTRSRKPSALCVALEPMHLPFGGFIIQGRVQHERVYGAHVPLDGPDHRMARESTKNWYARNPEIAGV